MSKILWQNGKHFWPWSNCSFRSSLIRVNNVCSGPFVWECLYCLLKTASSKHSGYIMVHRIITDYTLTWLQAENRQVGLSRSLSHGTSSLHDLLYCGLALYSFKHISSSTKLVVPSLCTASQETCCVWTPSSHVVEHGPQRPGFHCL